MPSYKEVLQINEQYAIDNQKEASAIKLLLMHFSKLDNAKLYQHLEDQMDTESYKRFLYAVDDYIKHHKPVQHITESEYFYGHKFCVNCNVLIPRYETEELVSYLLEMMDEYFENNETIDLVDIGTGSGCLATVLDLEDKRVTAIGTDISEEALKVARKNAELLNSNVIFKQGDMLEPVRGQTFDVLVSNPPYIPNNEKVDPLVKDHEPHIALFGGEDGLDFYRQIIEGAESILKERYIIAFEHAYDKAKQIKRLLKKNLKNVTIIQKKDMQGKDRMTFVLKKPKK